MLPYQIHTNRELGLMLKGTKPLAAFSDVYGGFPDVVDRYLAMFDRHVDTGRFVKTAFVVLNMQGTVRSYNVHHILYALESEEWRLAEMLALKLEMLSGWSAEQERREGRLLGYEEWQNDIWIEKFIAGRL